MTLLRYVYDVKRLRADRVGKKTTILVGFAPTTRELADWDDPNTEIWGLNEAYKSGFMKRWDRWFQFHSRANFSRLENGNDPDHFLWLKSARDYPIYMQKVWTDIPNSIRYPIENYLDTFGRYAMSSFAFMMGFAILEGFERIELYGFEMATDSEYFYQRANAEYMIGQALGRGIEVYIPPQCGLLKGPLYGYQNMSVGYRQQMEMRKQRLTQAKDQETNRFDMMSGSLSVWEGLTKLDPENQMYQDNLAKQVDAYQRQAALVNKLVGQLEEVNTMLKIYDAYPFEQEASDGWDKSLEVESGQA